MARGYKWVQAQGLRFAFAHDDDDPSILHIYARHLTTIDDALRVWFDKGAPERWNDQRQRFEVEGDRHVLYWSWLEYGRRVLIISCFEREG